MRKFGIIAMAIALMLSLAACDTVKGFGEDVSAVGSGIDDASTAVQNKL